MVQDDLRSSKEESQMLEAQLDAARLREAAALAATVQAQSEARQAREEARCPLSMPPCPCSITAFRNPHSKSKRAVFITRLARTPEHVCHTVIFHGDV